jgi:dephospho-CoA kinase
LTAARISRTIDTAKHTSTPLYESVRTDRTTQQACSQWIVVSPRTLRRFSRSTFVAARSFVPVLAIVGGVGSGKSAVAKWLAAERNVVIVDGDVAGHEVLKQSGVKVQLRHCFGDAIFDEQGEVNRSVLASRVFGDTAEQRRARAELEQVVHPQIRAALANQIEHIRNSNAAAAILLDAAVLFEAGWDDLCDAVIFVEVPEQTRLERVRRGRGWTDEIFKSREASQRSLDWKKQASDYVIDNSHSVAEAGAQLDQVLQKVLNKQALDN